MKKLFLLFVIFIVIVSVFSQIPDNKLHIYICNVGQGDGILLQKGSTQVVIDAGPDNSIEGCLGSHMPFWDRTIEVALMTHADSDHSFGFIEMAKRYTIKRFIGSTIGSNTKEYKELEGIISERNISVLGAASGEVVKFGGASLRVIFPTGNFIDEKTKPNETSQVLGSRTSSSTNDFCAVTYLKFENFTGLFTCDTSPSSEEEMLSLGVVPHAYFLKVPHHGSKNGLTQDFLNVVNPKLVAISVGKKNRYGHPSPEIIDMLKNFGTRILRTDLDGEIEISTDGKTVSVKK